MRPIVNEMVEFMETRTVGPCVAGLIQVAPKDDRRMDPWAKQLADDPNKDVNLAYITVRLMITDILRWLSKTGESEKREPLCPVNWPDSWRNFIRASSELSQLFEVGKDSLDFRPDISESERMETLNYIKRNYWPEVIE